MTDKISILRDSDLTLLMLSYPSETKKSFLLVFDFERFLFFFFGLAKRLVGALPVAGVEEFLPPAEPAGLEEGAPGPNWSGVAVPLSARPDGSEAVKAFLIAGIKDSCASAVVVPRHCEECCVSV